MTIGLFIVRATIGMALVLQGAAKVTREGRQGTGAALASIALGLAAAAPVLARRALHRRSMAIQPTATAEAG